MFTTLIFGEDVWNISTDSDKAVTKKFLNLGLQFNFIYYKPAENKKKVTSLLMINEGKPDKWFLKSMVEKFSPDISVMEYQTNYSLNYDEARYRAMRVKNYLKKERLVNDWPPLFLEVQEIHRELKNADYGEKILLVAGTQCNLLSQTDILKDFNAVILISPEEKIESMEKGLWKDKKVLWVGGLYEKAKMQNLQNKFGGSVLSYERSSTGKDLLMRNTKVLDDILSWIKN